MYLEDTPIKRQEEDLLHRSNFAKRMGKSLLDSEAKNGYCIGLFGPWGSGKSSIINMILEELDNLTRDQEEKPIIIYFNPWNFSSPEQLLQQYFLILANKFSSQKDKRLSAIGNEFQKYAEMFDMFGNLGKIVGTGGRLAAIAMKRKSIMNTEDISKQKERLIKKLDAQSKKVIVVMDDIDRLSNHEIKLIFQLVNSVAKFPNTIYLLSFDKEIVTRALTDVQNYDGEKYLEKIIQVPIEIPEAQNDYLWAALFARLDEVINSHKGIIWEKDYWGRIFSECISQYTRNIRDVVRLVNVLSFKCDMIGRDVNFVDLIAITLIEIKFPKLYRWIKINESRLVGGEHELLRYFNKNASDIEEMNLRELRDIDPERAEEYYDILKLLFPYYASKANSFTYDNADLMLRMRRIGHKDIFHRYFALEVDEKAIHREEFERAVFRMSEPELELYLHQVSSNKGIISFLKELKAAAGDIQTDRIPVLINTLLRTVNMLDSKETETMLGLSIFDMVKYRIIDLLLRRSDQPDRFQMLKDMINSADENSISILCSLINTIELAHGRLAAKGEKKGEKLISLDQLEQCETLITEKIIQISGTCCLLDLYQSRRVLYLYECLAEKSCDQYMNDILQDDLNKLKFLGDFVSKWVGSKIGWNLNSGYEKFLNDSVLEKAIENCRNDNRIWTLDEEDQHRVIAYLLWKEEGLQGDDEVEDEDVIKRIHMLRNQQV